MTTGFSRADFLRAVESTTVSKSEKAYAEAYQAVWAEPLHWTVTETNKNRPLAERSIEFTEGGRVNGVGHLSVLTATIDIGATQFPLPNPLLHTQLGLLHRITENHSDVSGAGAYWIESHFYGSDLRLGATGMASGAAEVVGVYDKNLSALLSVKPTT